MAFPNLGLCFPRLTVRALERQGLPPVGGEGGDCGGGVGVAVGEHDQVVGGLLPLFSASSLARGRAERKTAFSQGESEVTELRIFLGFTRLSGPFCVL